MKLHVHCDGRTRRHVAGSNLFRAYIHCMADEIKQQEVKIEPMRLLTLSQAAELVPAGTYTKLRRWAIDGAVVRGQIMKLRTVMSGPCRYTSAEWVRAFCEQIDAAAGEANQVAVCE